MVMLVEAAFEILRGSVAPPFSLPSTRGRDIILWDYKQRKNVVLYFFHAQCFGCRRGLAEFSANYQEYRSLEAEVLGIGGERLPVLEEFADELSIPFPLLADVDSYAASRYGLRRGEKTSHAVFALDRYNAIEESWVLGEGEAPDQGDVLATVQLAQSRCPE